MLSPHPFSRLLESFLRLGFILLLFCAFTLIQPGQVRAEDCSLSKFGINSPDLNQISIDSGTQNSVTFSINYKGLNEGQWYGLFAYDRNVLTPDFLISDYSAVFRAEPQPAVIEKSMTLKPNTNEVGRNLILDRSGVDVQRDVYVYSCTGQDCGGSSLHCKLGSYTIISNKKYICPSPPQVYQTRIIDGVENTCYSSGCLDTSPLYVSLEGVQNAVTQEKYNGVMMLDRPGPYASYLITVEDGNFLQKLLPDEFASVGSHSVRFGRGIPFFNPWEGCTTSYTISPACPSGCNTTPPTSGSNTEINFDLCKQVTAALEPKCTECFGKGAIWTAVGCIETKPQSIIQAVVKIGVGIGGGIALLMTLVGGFLLTTSQGDPKRTQEGKEMITSSVIGILFVLFSVVILQFIGVTIFRIPGFGT